MAKGQFAFICLLLIAIGAVLGVGFWDIAQSHRRIQEELLAVRSGESNQPAAAGESKGDREPQSDVSLPKAEARLPSPQGNGTPKSTPSSQLWGPLTLQLVYNTPDAKPVVGAEVKALFHSGKPAYRGKTNAQGLLRVERTMYEAHAVEITLGEAQFRLPVIKGDKETVSIVLPIVINVRPRIKWPKDLRDQVPIVVCQWYAVELGWALFVFPTGGFSSTATPEFAILNNDPSRWSRSHTAEFVGHEEDSSTSEPTGFGVVVLENSEKKQAELTLPWPESYKHGVRLLAFRYSAMKQNITPVAKWPDWFGRKHIKPICSQDESFDFRPGRMVDLIADISYDNVDVKLEEGSGTPPILWLIPNENALAQIRMDMAIVGRISKNNSKQRQKGE